MKVQLLFPFIATDISCVAIVVCLFGLCLGINLNSSYQLKAILFEDFWYHGVLYKLTGFDSSVDENQIFVETQVDFVRVINDFTGVLGLHDKLVLMHLPSLIHPDTGEGSNEKDNADNEIDKRTFFVSTIMTFTLV